MSMKVSGIKVNESDLLCRNKCGYYGNPSWYYYCSVCYRNVYLKKKSSKAVNPEVSQNVINSFTKFEEKRKAVSSKTPNTVKNIFKTNKELESHDTSDSYLARQRFENYLSKLKKPLAIDITKQIKIHLDVLEETKFVKIEQHSELVQKFYERLMERIKSDSSYKGLTEEQADTLMSEIERYLTIQIYDWAFKPNISEDESQDLELQKKIRSLHWITPDMLDASFDEDNEKVKPHYEEAISAMIEMDTHLCPQDKLDCIVRCCKAVVTSLREQAAINSPTQSPNKHKLDSTSSPNSDTNADTDVSKGDSAIVESKRAFEQTRIVNADDFLPALIYILIRCNPPLLISNIQFIMRFARPALINSGEDGYMFTNISIAVEFLKKMDHKSLGLSEKEYSDAMQGINRPVSKGKLLEAKNKSLEATFAALQILDNNEKVFKKLDEKIDLYNNNLIMLEDEIIATDAVNKHKIESLQSEVPLKFSTDYNGDQNHDIDVANQRYNNSNSVKCSLDDILLADNNDEHLKAKNQDSNLSHEECPVSDRPSLPPPINPIRSVNYMGDKENLDYFLDP